MAEYTKLKSAINGFYHDGQSIKKAYIGDILCFNHYLKDTDSFFKKTGDVGDFYYENGMFSSDIDLTKGTPIGMVVIPRNFIPSSPKGRVMSLVNMSCSGFTGTTSDETMYFGLNNVSLTSTTEMKYYSGLPHYGTGTNVSTTNFNGYRWYNLFYPTDRFDDGQPQHIQSPEYKNGHYSSSGSSDYHGVCPYIMDDSGNITFNEKYISGDTNACSDLDGYNNTEILASFATATTDWKTANKIYNVASEGYAPCAQACKRFNVGGLEWYLPACGEMGFLMPKKQVLRNQLQKLIDNGGTAAQFNDENYKIMSSSTSYSNTYKFGYWQSYESINYYQSQTANKAGNNNIQRAFALI